MPGVTDLTKYPWTFDAADNGGAFTIPFTFLGNVNAGPYGKTVPQNWSMGTFNWTAHDAAEGDQVIITDINGKELWRSAPATGADFEDQFRTTDSVYASGFILKQMQHGVLEVFFR